MIKRYKQRQALYILKFIPLSTFIKVAELQYMKQQLTDYYYELSNMMIKTYYVHNS